MYPPERAIVVGVDGSEPAFAALRWAAAEAVLRGRPLHVVHAYSWPVSAAAMTTPAYSWSEPMVRGQAEALVAEAVAGARAMAAGVEVAGHCRYGPPQQVLLDLSRTAELVVVGDRGRGGFAALLLGSVANAVAAHAHCPVAVVRTGAPDAGCVVVGVADQSSSEAPLDLAFDAAHRRGHAVLVVHSWEPPAPPWHTDVRPLVSDVAELETAEQAMVRDWIRLWREKYPDVAAEIRVTSRRPAQALVHASAGAGLLVVGSRGRGGFAGLLLGSVSQQVIHHAACPVLVAR